MRCWGDNCYGQLGDNTVTIAAVPPMNDVISDVQAIAAGAYFTCALTTGGVRCWGSNEGNPLGDMKSTSTANYRVSPPETDFITGIQSMATGYEHACGLTLTGGLSCWGNGGYTFPIGRLDPNVATDVRSVAAGHIVTCALKTNSDVRCWGDHRWYGPFGQYLSDPRASDVVISDVKAIFGKEYTFCAIITAGGVRCWGDGDEGQLGDGNVTNSAEALQVIETCQ